MKLRVLFSLVLVNSMLLMAGCASSGKKSPEEATLIGEENPAPERSTQFERVGIVKLVNTRSGFVLIEGRVIDLPPDLALKTFDPSVVPRLEGETAVLKVSLERASRFVVADIVSGLPGKGDVVYR